MKFKLPQEEMEFLISVISLLNFPRGNLCRLIFPQKTLWLIIFIKKKKDRSSFSFGKFKFHIGKLSVNCPRVISYFLFVILLCILFINELLSIVFTYSKIFLEKVVDFSESIIWDYCRTDRYNLLIFCSKFEPWSYSPPFN